MYLFVADAYRCVCRCYVDVYSGPIPTQCGSFMVGERRLGQCGFLSKFFDQLLCKCTIDADVVTGL